MAYRGIGIAWIAIAALVATGLWLCGPAPKDPPRSISPTLSATKPGVFHLPRTPARPPVDVVVDYRETDNWYWEEDLVIRTSCPERKWSAARPFDAGYGRFRVDLVDLSGDGVEEFLFILKNGRGTGPLPHDLIVDRIDNNQFTTLLNRPQSEPYGPSVAWRYEPQYVDVNGDGTTDVRLVLEYDPPQSKWLVAPECVPSEQIVEYVWDDAKSDLAFYGVVKRFDFGLMTVRLRRDFDDALRCLSGIARAADNREAVLRR